MPIEIDASTLVGAFTAIGAFFAWVIRYLLQDIKKVVENNTAALSDVKLTLEKCKFIQKLEE